MKYKLAVIKGDGIGVEIVDSAIQVLKAIEKKHDVEFELVEVCAGGASIDKYGKPLVDEELQKCKNSDSVLLGAVGGPKWDTLPGNLRPERALLGIRKELGLFANIRPAKLMKILKSACPLKEEVAEKGFDMVILRELTGGIYYGERGRKNGSDVAFDTMQYSKSEVERIVRMAFELAQKRKKELISIDKANVLESSRLWREVVENMNKQYDDVKVTNMLVDNAAMQLVKNPSQFDVVVTANMFGDILSDEASQITGSIGLLPSASLGEGTCGMYEPIHGSAPDIAGQNIANPIATILSLAMMFRHSFDKEKIAVQIENAVLKVLENGYRTVDILDNGTKPLGTKEMTQKIIEYLV